MHHQDPHFFGLPKDLFHKILMEFTPEEIAGPLFLINKAFQQKSKNNEFWLRKFEIHFPHVLIKIKNENPYQDWYKIDWYKEFIFTYSVQYKGIVERKLQRHFSYLKEGRAKILFGENAPYHPRTCNSLKSRTELDSFDADQKSMLDWAAQIKNPQQLEGIFQLKESYLNNPSYAEYHTGRTLLYWAFACLKSIELIRALMSRGFDISSHCDGHSKPIHIAAQLGRLDLVNLMLERKSGLLNIDGQFGLTPLMYAALNGHLDVVDALLKIKNIDPHASIRRYSDYQGMNALHLASKNGHHDVIDSLLKAGVDASIHTQNTMRYLSIHLAARAHEGSALASVKVLCENNPELVDKPDTYGQTALLWAAAQGNYAVVEFLSARQDVNLNARTLCVNDNNNKSALHWAAEAGYSEIVKLLLKRGADARLISSEMGLLPIHMAVLNHSSNKASLSKKQAYLETIKVFIEHDRDLINAKDIAGKSLLMLAVMQSDTRLIQYLISRDNIDLNAEIVGSLDQSQNGNTALYLAATMEMSETVKILLRIGAKCSRDKPLQISGLKKEVQDVFERHENMCKRKSCERLNTPFSFFYSSFGERVDTIQCSMRTRLLR